MRKVHQMLLLSTTQKWLTQCKQQHPDSMNAVSFQCWLPYVNHAHWYVSHITYHVHHNQLVCNVCLCQCIPASSLRMMLSQLPMIGFLSNAGFRMSTMLIDMYHVSRTSKLVTTVCVCVSQCMPGSSLQMMFSQLPHSMLTSPCQPYLTLVSDRNTRWLTTPRAHL